MIVAGLGFRERADVASLQDAFHRAAKGYVVGAISTVADKADSSVFLELARSLRLPIVRVDPGNLSSADTPTQSAHSQAARDSGSVAEASALSAAGPGATLVKPRVISADRCATCALAQTGEEGHMP